jgi:hypothetical protein
MSMVGSRRVHLGVLGIAAALMVLAAAGCGGSNATPPIIYITPKPAPITRNPNATPAPAPAIDSVVIATTAPDSRWTVTFKKPVVSGIPAGTSGKIDDAIAAKVNGYISAFTSQQLPALANGAGPSTLEGDFTIALDTATIISLRFSVLTFVSGAAGPTGEAGSMSFNVASGATLNLSDLFTDPAAALPIITSKCKASLTAALGSDLKWPSGSQPLTFFDKAWAFTPAGLEFSWSQGAIASQASGTPSAVVAWADLKSVIKSDGPAAEFIA